MGGGQASNEPLCVGKRQLRLQAVPAHAGALARNERPRGDTDALE